MTPSHVSRCRKKSLYRNCVKRRWQIASRWRLLQTISQVLFKGSRRNRNRNVRYWDCKGCCSLNNNYSEVVLTVRVRRFSTPLDPLEVNWLNKRLKIDADVKQVVTYSRAPKFVNMRPTKPSRISESIFNVRSSVGFRDLQNVVNKSIK